MMKQLSLTLTFITVLLAGCGRVVQDEATPVPTAVATVVATAVATETRVVPQATAQAEPQRIRR
ncbi:MAG: hypothetical protein KDE59_09150 [Anaerolineales bacterium]|nr:hypothetical protein [Anaerolineales bacterium]